MSFFYPSKTPEPARIPFLAGIPVFFPFWASIYFEPGTIVAISFQTLQRRETIYRIKPAIRDWQIGPGRFALRGIKVKRKVSDYFSFNSNQTKHILFAGVLAAVLLPTALFAHRQPPVVQAPVEKPVNSAYSSDPLPFSLGEVDGVGDYHAHQIGDLGFDGRLYWGDHKGSEAHAMRSCSGTNHAVNYIPGFLTNLFHSNELGMHHFATHGYHSDPNKRYTDWPLWKSIVHQQYWEGHLKQAHDQGLNLMVMSAVNFDMLCGILPKGNGFGQSCDDMVNIERQLRAAHDFDKKHDWYKIVKTPAEARRAIQEGRMAVILAVEASKIWGNSSSEADLNNRLNKLWDLGVRSFQPVHEIDNNVAGPAYFQALFDIFTAIDKVKQYASGGFKGGIGGLVNAVKGIQLDSNKHNKLGLTPLGRKLIQKLMARRAIVDLAHISERAFNQTYDLAAANKYYPLFVSHAHFRDLYSGKHADEKKLSAASVRKIKKTGGVIGLRTGEEKRKTYTKSGVANTCHGSSRSFAQSYTYGVLGLRVPIGLGVDMTGFITQMRPRFYSGSSKWNGSSVKKWACGNDVKTNERELAQARQGNRNTYGTRTDFDLIGYGHIGHTRNMLRDLNKLGVDTTQLDNSAEAFIQMWERQYEGSRKALNDYVDTSGIEDDHGQEAKCPGLRAKLGALNNKPVCKALPHFKIKKRKCDGSQWNGYCVWNKGSWYKARQLK